MLENIAFILDVLVFSFLSIAWFFLPAFELLYPEVEEVMSLHTAKEKEEEKKSDFIDNQLLRAKQYTISEDQPFGYKYRFREFEVYRLNMDDSSDAAGVSIDDEYIADDASLPLADSLDKDVIRRDHFLHVEREHLTMGRKRKNQTFGKVKRKSVANMIKKRNKWEYTPLQMTLELVPNGFIINSNVYLTHQQWNTLYAITDELRRCAVCDVSCDVNEHIRTTLHAGNMMKYRPLHRHDLTITRKINNTYHCGVCNIVFDQSLRYNHFSSKSHEDKLLFAINKVSDIMYDYNIHNNNIEKKDSYYFNVKHNHQAESYMLENYIEPEESEDEYEYNEDDWLPLDYKDSEYSEEYFEEPMQNLEFSYATMAKKPKSEDMPDVLEVDLGNKKLTVRFNSWHMIIRPMPNRFYCMACKRVDHVRKVAEHCKSDEHLARLGACTVVEEYEKYFVRQVDDKCYHCGHCNNLQLINVMEDHIRSVHTHPTTAQALLDSPAKKISTPVKTNPAKTNTEITRSNNQNEQVTLTNEVNKVLSTAVTMYEGLKAANSNFDDIVICTYGSNMRISKIAFNIICQGENSFYCGLCEVNIVKEHLKFHMNDEQHLAKLQRAPFIQAFNVHLFRQIRDALHCGLCNELVQIMPEFIIKHKYLEKHIVSLNRAQGYLRNENEAKNGAKDTINNGAAKPKPEIAKTLNFNGISNKTDVSAFETNNIATVNAIKKDALFTNKDVPLNNIPAANIATTAPVSNNNVSNMAKTLQATNKNVPNTATFTSKNAVATNIGINYVKDKITTANTNRLNSLTDNKENQLDIANMIDAVAQLIRTEEFVFVKNGVKEEMEDDLDNSYIEDFDLEEYVYVKLGNSYIKITNTSYNTLVDVGDGSKYCFVCSSVVCELSKHVESRGHMENMDKFKFVDKYNEDLLRQFYLMYHCSICNVVITRKQLTHHLSWPTHALQTENTKITSKKRKTEIKTGTKQITVTTQKENIYLNEKESDIKIYLNIAIEKEKQQIVKLNKIVIFNDNVLKVSFDFWHSLSEVGNGYRCKVCQFEFVADEFRVHVASESHKGNLEKIERQYYPALIRKINEVTLNCVMCNTELTNKKPIVSEHIQGKKHVKQYDAMLRESSVANSYADCDQDVVML